ncbi:MAG: class I lanthipeptide [Pirellulales bacterium]|nr:class I lanthipeptide [Pirellulales bacterium]
MSLNKKLTLKKDTVRALSGTEMQGVVGGVNYALIRAADAATGHCGICTKSCATCGCPKRDFGNVILPAFNQLRAF